MKNKYKISSYLIGITVFLLSMIMFYYLFLFVSPAPLTLENHVGFFIWSALPAILMAFLLIKKRRMGLVILLIGMISASSSLIYEIIQSKINGIGTLGAVLSYILIMIITIALTLIIEGTLLIIRIVRRSSYKN
jgi:hypothetical protein